jgi:Tol biopolymer transport system component
VKSPAYFPEVDVPGSTEGGQQQPTYPEGVAGFRVCGFWFVPVAAGGLAVSLPAVADAAFPGRNGRIAYAGRGSDPTAYGVYSVRPDGTGRRLILRDGPPSPYIPLPRYSEPAYAARGARIAFIRSVPSPIGPDRLIGSLWLARSDGSQRRQLVDAGPFGSVSAPAWAPDGRQIAFYRNPCGAYYQGDHLYCPPEVYRPSDFGLFVYRRGHIRLLTRHGHVPSWSPNGRLIAFVSEGALYVIRPDGSGRRRIATKRTVESVDWAPDGRRLVFGYTSDGWRRVASIRPDGRGFRRLALNGSAPVYSPDGRQIAFSDGGILMTMRADGKRQHRIRLPSGDAIQGFSPSWQPRPARRRR